MGKMLIICEKHSVAKMIAQAYKHTKKAGYYELQPNKHFPKGGYIAYAAGHLLTIKEPQELSEKWKEWRLESLPIIPERLEIKVDKDKNSLLQTIKHLANKSDIIVNAGDVDVEGTFLVHEIILYLGIKKPIKRLWLTSLTPNAIRKAVSNMKDFSETEYMYWQGLSRSEADWLYGMNFSRQFTLLLSEHPQLKDKKFLSNVFSVGRVQTVVNYLIYKRELAIENFKSEPFWDVYAEIQIEDQKYKGKWFVPDSEHLFYKEQADFLINEIKDKCTEVIDVKSEEKLIRPPQFYNLTSLQKAVDKKIGLSPDQTLEELQQLYLSGYISYPRTQIVYVGEGEAATFPKVLENLSGIHRYKSVLPAPISDISKDTRFVNPAKVQEHYGIILTEKPVDFEKLNDNQKVIYDLIAKSMIAAHYPDVKVKEVNIVTLIDKQYTFLSKGRQIIDKGWYHVWPSKNEDEIVPPLTEGQQGKVVGTEIKEGKTKPLTRWSEADVVVMMANAYKVLPPHVRSKYSTDELALGTVATRAEIVKKLKDRGYIEVKKNKVYITPKGRILALSMEDINLFTSPITSGNMQKHLNEEIKDQTSYRRFIQGIKNRIERTFEEVLKRHETWDFSSVDFSKLPLKTEMVMQQQAEPIGVCPVCSGYVYDKGPLYGCENESVCDFKLWKRQFGREIELEHAQSLLQNLTTPLLEFYSKRTNKTYAAYIVWNQDKHKTELSFPK